jgi:hypothetical protein
MRSKIKKESPIFKLRSWDCLLSKPQYRRRFGDEGDVFDHVFPILNCYLWPLLQALYVCIYHSSTPCVYRRIYGRFILKSHLDDFPWVHGATCKSATCYSSHVFKESTKQMLPTICNLATCPACTLICGVIHAMVLNISEL